MRLSVNFFLDKYLAPEYIKFMNQPVIKKEITKHTNSDIELDEIVRTLKKTMQKVKSLKKISVKNSNIISSQDLFSKQLSKKNAEKLDNLQKNTSIETGKKLELMADIMFTNFEITNSNMEIMKAYIDEYYDRFLLLEKSLSMILKQLELVANTVSKAKGDK